MSEDLIGLRQGLVSYGLIVCALLGVCAGFSGCMIPAPTNTSHVSFPPVTEATVIQMPSYSLIEGRRGIAGDNVLLLPEPRYTSDISIEQALITRRSVRVFSGEALTLEEISQILWAAQGIVDRQGRRTAPSANMLYPLELYVVAGNIRSLPAGVYHYSPQQHSLQPMISGDFRKDISAAALNQPHVSAAAAVIVISSVPSRMTIFADRGRDFMYLEAGHVSENIYLQVAALHLGTVSVGTMDPAKVRSVARLNETEVPIYLMPIGKLP